MNATEHNTRIDGKALAARVQARVAYEVESLATEHSVTPGLAVVWVGRDPASQVYVQHKRRQAADVGMQSYEYNLSQDTSQATLLRLIRELNDDPHVHGILVQLPLPDHISTPAVVAAVDPDKDVDGFHEVNIGRLWRGDNGPVPCTAMACSLLLDQVHVDGLSGLHAVVLGRSNIVGKPLANLLLRRDCTVTMAHSQTRDLPAVCRGADIVIAAVGRPKMVRGDWIRNGATVIDVGINQIDDAASGRRRLVGDVAFSEACQVAGAITPVPGGVGPMTIACLLDNTVAAARRQLALNNRSDNVFTTGTAGPEPPSSGATAPDFAVHGCSADA